MSISIGISQDVHSLIRLPELANTMQKLSSELTKAGITPVKDHGSSIQKSRPAG